MSAPERRDEAAEGEGLTRRGFLRASALAGGGLLLAVRWDPLPAAEAAGAGSAPPGAFEPNAWLLLTPDDRIVFRLDKTEMGQGTSTALPTLVAEELRVDPERIHVELAPVDRLFQDPLQVTGGSTSVATRWLPLRRTGAAARELLRSAAARTWGVPLEAVLAEDGQLIERDGERRGSYGAFATAAAAERVPEDPPLTAPEDFRWIGRPLPRRDRVAKATGRATFGIDVAVSPEGPALPGLATAVVVRAPRFGAELVSFEDGEARAVPGVLDVVRVPTGVAIVAEGYWPARTAAGRLGTRWTPGPLAGVDSDGILAAQREALERRSGRRVRDDGDFHDALADAATVLEAEYRVPYLAHATLEPMNSTAWYREGRCEVWAPTQGPDVTRALVADAVDLPRSAVTVYSTLMGGGFGRRGIPDFAAEAAAVSRAAGRPVKVLWSREDDTRHDYYRPATCNRMRATLDGSGRVTGWEHRMAAPSMVASLLPSFSTAVLPGWVPGGVVGALAGAARPLLRTRDASTHEGAAELPYAIPHLRVEHVFHDPGVPLGFWRSVGHSQNAFVVEAFVDELAHAAGEDPLQFRLDRLADHPRHRAVLERVRDAAPWGLTAEGRFQGVAVHESFGTVVAQIAEVSVADGGIRVHRVTCAADCGRVVNPAIVRAQLESGIVFGLTAALKGEITIDDGAVVQSNFHDYPLLRLDECPAIDVHLLERETDPSGVGEPGTPPIAPAVANAVFAATGRRLRSLPLRL